MISVRDISNDRQFQCLEAVLTITDECVRNGMVVVPIANGIVRVFQLKNYFMDQVVLYIKLRAKKG
jgi:hypothetical protein